MFFYGESDTGLVRRENQDSYVFSEIKTDCFLAAVFDGMGGLSFGSLASSLAKESLVEYLSEAMKNREPSHIGDSEMKDLLSDAVAYASHILYTRSLKAPEHESMGTTLAAILATSKKAYVFHVGDSRVYALISGKFHRLTKDHTLVQYLIDTKQINAHEAENHPQKHVLIKAIGTEDFVSPDISVIHLSKVKHFLICSDGLTIHVSDDEIESVIKEKSSEKEKVSRLISLTKERGAYDNTTVIALSPSDTKTHLRKERS